MVYMGEGLYRRNSIEVVQLTCNKNIILFSTGCPRCEMLMQKLTEKNIPFIINSDIDKMLALGIFEVPKLQVGDKLLDFRDAYLWANEQ